MITLFSHRRQLTTISKIALQAASCGYRFAPPLLVLFALGACPSIHAEALDLSQASILRPANADGPEMAAIQLLLEEAAKRSGIKWKIQSDNSAVENEPCEACIVVGRVDQIHRPIAWPVTSRKPESFHVQAIRNGSHEKILIAGQDDRGVLYGIGYLLRHLEFSSGRVVFPAPLNLYSAPQFSVRGHQLGYRFKNNTYDAWTPERFEQYIRDLAVFGSNTIELLPPKTDDAPSSPLFPLPAMEMMTRVSGIIKKYGLRCSVFYPALAADYSDPKTAAAELQAWGDVFKQLPQLDELFVPGGDPGHTDPAVLFPFLARVADVLHQSHPNAGVWVSSQGFNAEQMNRFYALVAARPGWLAGVVVGPQSRDALDVQRAHIPRQIPIRFYPDIAHTMHCQFPVPEWDEAYALTEGREVIDPRPVAETEIFRHYASFMTGFVTYSEGVNDDVNKFIWSALGWSAKTNPAETLQEYARYFVGIDGFSADVFARGILALERNWQGPLAANLNVDLTLRQFQQMEKTSSRAQKKNWRFEAALYRAYSDAYERHRLLAATQQEKIALESLAAVDRVGSAEAMQNVQEVLAVVPPEMAELHPLRDKIENLASRLFQDIGLQLSVRKYGASAVDRGASLDTVDVSLNDRNWLDRQFARIHIMSEESERVRALKVIAHWRDPGPGGYYDDLGDPSAEPHLVRGPGFPSDPAFFQTALDGIADRNPDQGWKLSEISYAGALYDRPLRLTYTGLRTNVRYKLRVIYAGEDYTLPLTLVANGRYTIQSPHLRASNPETVEYVLPLSATQSGTLDLRWTRPSGIGGGGRGLQVAEVWLSPQADNYAWMIRGSAQISSPK